MKNGYALIGLATELVGLELILIYAGSYLDKRFEWNGLGVIAGAVLGLAIWIYHLIVTMQRLEKSEGSDEKNAD